MQKTFLMRLRYVFKDPRHFKAFHSVESNVLDVTKMELAKSIKTFFLIFELFEIKKNVTYSGMVCYIFKMVVFGWDGPTIALHFLVIF